MVDAVGGDGNVRVAVDVEGDGLLETWPPECKFHRGFPVRASARLGLVRIFRLPGKIRGRCRKSLDSSEFRFGSITTTMNQRIFTPFMANTKH